MQTWDKLRQHLNTIEARESLRVRLQQLQTDISGFVQDERKREVVRRADRLLRNIRTEEMEGVALAIVPLLEMVGHMCCKIRIFASFSSANSVKRNIL